MLVQIPLPFSIDYRSSFSLITDPQLEPPVYHPLYLGQTNNKEASFIMGLKMLRENVKTVRIKGSSEKQVLSVEGIGLGENDEMLSGVDALFKKYILC